MQEIGGWLWFIIDVVAVILIGLAMFYAGYQYAHRNRRGDALADEVTRRNYAEEDRRAGRTTPPDPLSHRS